MGTVTKRKRTRVRAGWSAALLALAVAAAPGGAAQVVVPSLPDLTTVGVAEAARLAAESGRVAALARRGLAHAMRPMASLPAANAPAAWLQEDPADSLYRAARAALNGRRWERAAELFGEIHERHPRSGYAADAYYFQALALHRAGGSARNQRALALIEEQASRHPGATSRADAEQLAVRARAELARSGDARAAAAVESSAGQACDGADQDLRATALSALLHMDAERARPMLMEVLRSRGECSAELRERAVFLVAQKLDDEAVDILLDLAHRDPDPDAGVREQAVFWLSNVKTPEATAALESLLRESADGDVQENAVFALSRQGTPRAVEVLRDYAGRAEAPREVRKQAIFWLGRNPPAGGEGYLRELYPTLTDDDLKEAVIFGVAQGAGEAARAWLVERALDASESPEMRKNALFWAGRSGGVDVGELTDLYEAFGDREMKEQVIFVLSRHDDPGAVDALMAIARDEDDPELRENAIFWLGRSGDPRVPEFLMTLIRGGGR